MKSMTGYSKVECQVGNHNVTIEIKTLNSKQLDTIVKLPTAFRSRELEIRTLLSKLERGKVECIISNCMDALGKSTINQELIADRYKGLKQLADELGADSTGLFSIVASSPDVYSDGVDAELTDEQWLSLFSAVEKAINDADEFRKHEGEVLERDFVLHVERIENLLEEIPQYESQRVDAAKERIRRMMTEAEVKELDENRFEQEMIYYLEKLDITEEKVRLKKHIDYFRHTMQTEPTCGKKLGFVAQEMGREINTTGSKANHVEIQRIVVAMKDELEKIKEQLGNVL